MKRLNGDMIRARSNNFDNSSVFSLSLASLEIGSLDSVINECTSMWNLDLAHNKLDGSSLSTLDGSLLVKLRTLCLSNNSICSIAEMKALATLENLYLQGNQLTSLDELVQTLPKKFPSLKSLYLKIGGQLANPVCNDPRYRDRLLAALPSLQILDGERVRRKDADLHRLSEDIRTKTFNGLDEKSEALTVPPSSSWFAGHSIEVSTRDDDAPMTALPLWLRPLQSKIEGVKTAIAECRNLNMECAEMIRAAETKLLPVSTT